MNFMVNFHVDESEFCDKLRVWKTFCTFVLIYFVLPNPQVSSALNHLERCSPSAYKLVSQYPIFVIPTQVSFATPSIILLSSQEKFPELTLTHEAYHLWQWSVSDEDMANYKADPFARFRVEYAANTNSIIEDVRKNCR